MNKHEIDGFDSVINKAISEGLCSSERSYDEFISALQNDDAESLFDLSVMCQVVEGTYEKSGLIYLKNQPIWDVKVLRNSLQISTI